jgi:hypothetical protein
VLGIDVPLAALLSVIQDRTKGAGPSPEMEELITIADTLRTGGTAEGLIDTLPVRI